MTSSDTRKDSSANGYGRGFILVGKGSGFAGRTRHHNTVKFLGVHPLAIYNVTTEHEMLAPVLRAGMTHMTCDR